MSSSSPPDAAAAKLLERLQSVRRQLEAEPGAKRRAALARELSLQLAGIPAVDQPALLERAMGAILPSGASQAQPAPAGGGDKAALAALSQQLEAARAEHAALVKERDLLRATRDGLIRENGKLRAELEKPVASHAPGAAGGTLEAFRAGLKDAIAGKKVDAEKLGLPAGDVRLFRLTQELVNFIHLLDHGRVNFLNTVGVGLVGKMGTQLFREYQARVRKQILAVLNDEKGSIQALRKSLDAQNQFVFGALDAYQVAIPSGTEALLRDLSPEPALEKARGRLMTDFEGACKELIRLHSDLSNLTPDERWQNYFASVFQDRLAEATKES
jgi:hypothetical protein